ncbi:MAG: hypothetical protein ACD_56C00101G0001 [uncultured bacterium]|nr:MAG: hypothetical protein ACD_56C00101G0001 [uncultured bacterium]
MLVVKTKLKEIEGRGIGLIADQEIKKGQATWIFNSIIDIKVLKKNITEEVKDFFDTYAIDEGEDYLLLNADNTRFTNHSKNPNTKAAGKNRNIAVKDIHIGEEITIDYDEIDVKGVAF